MTSQPGLVFGADPAHYDRHRPAVPELVAEWMVPPICPVAIDTGAGTGHFTRILLSRAERVIAVDPDTQMCTWLRKVYPAAEVHLGASEKLPVADRSADGVFSCNAWHWFDPAAAAAEAARCLQPGGVLGVSWHDRAASSLWLDEVQEVVLSGHDPARQVHEFTLPADLPFTPVEKHIIAYELEMTPRAIRDMHSTYSAIISLSDEEREPLLGRLLDHLTERARERGTPTLTIPFMATCYRAYRLE
ncbi:SAM-dependent methyltransferase [Kibdelosporangium banguiense]|uniref:SAM-dependent methyltransferase n=1 Tax=Kibdelosporangium banguiense TaxID=1365924 RepID=A0ABS4U3S8_9PSEU|nr:class I SAM-dependent methyltransferase [Kibdelosporangium banguiense]MBP2330845.1 SAM-dependent methyltransferase [Kibdelosporangium banguiense]